MAEPLPLPHAYPFVLLDRVVRRERDAVVALKHVTFGDPWIQPGGWMPSVFLAEIMAQAGGLAIRTDDTPRAVRLVRIHRFRCRPPFRVGDRLLVTARVVRRFGPAVRIHASVRIAGRLRAATEVVLHCPD